MKTKWKINTKDIVERDILDSACVPREPYFLAERACHIAPSRGRERARPTLPCATAITNSITPLYISQATATDAAAASVQQRLILQHFITTELVLNRGAAARWEMCSFHVCSADSDEAVEKHGRGMRASKPTRMALHYCELSPYLIKADKLIKHGTSTEQWTTGIAITRMRR